MSDEARQIENRAQQLKSQVRRNLIIIDEVIRAAPVVDIKVQAERSALNRYLSDLDQIIWDARKYR